MRTVTPQGEKRRELLLAAIVEHWQQHGIGPTLLDLQRATGITTPNGVRVLILELERRGLVERKGFRAGAIWPKGLRGKIRNMMTKELSA